MSNARNLARLLPNTSGQLPDAAMASGSVIQVVNTPIVASFETNSTAYVDVGVSATITPTFANSKILVQVDMAGVYKHSGDCYGKMQLLRNGTVLEKMEGAFGYTNSSLENNIGACTTSWVDSPATTSAVTYKIQIATSGGGNVGIGRNQATSAITLMEIAG